MSFAKSFRRFLYRVERLADTFGYLSYRFSEFNTAVRAHHNEPSRGGDEPDQTHLAKLVLQLHLAEYQSLRAEQRTRLDSANKIIHYSALVLAAVVAGLLGYKGDHFNDAFRIVLLLYPVLAMPFAFAQQNEEIMVRRIGGYLQTRMKPMVKGTVDRYGNPRFWEWEDYHLSEHPPWPLLFTAGARSSVLLIAVLLDLVTYLKVFGRPWKQPLASLFLLDLILLIVGSWVALRMGKQRIGGSA